MTEQIRRYAIIGVLSQHRYMAVWHIAETLGVDLIEFGGCGTSGVWSSTIDTLVAEGIIEEVPDLGCRYRLKVQP
ncbi:MAG: hypothetical protein KDK05_03870 [Candidatus Competibacteraceae bacterium]|nr:hypothetical protein [Candidatus Competibacteraceae bacterium]